METAQQQPPRPGTAAHRRRTRMVGALAGTGVAMVALYSILFQVLMATEGQSHSWATGVYWTITTMSTLGYGDVTFTSDGGRIFSVVVLISGATLIALLLPFALIQFVVTPWLAQRDAARAPHRVPPGMHGHLIIAGFDPVVQALIARAKRAGVPAVLIVPEAEQAPPLLDAGYQVLVGPLDAPSTYRNARAQHAALVVSTLPDTANTNVVFTVRSISPDVPIAVTANKHASIDVLELAGADHVLHLGAILGNAMAQRVLGTRGQAHVIGELGDVLVAEAGVHGTTLAGSTLAQVREQIGAAVRNDAAVQVLAVMHHGRSTPMNPGTVLPDAATVILAATSDGLTAYDAAFSHPVEAEAPVVILGGGRVGRAAATALAAAPTPAPTTIVEQNPARPHAGARVLHGDAAESAILAAAGLHEASAVLVTTHDDDLNVYLTLYCRKLRPEVQIVSRATQERNVATLYRAGADAVLSYAAIGATTIWNTAGLGQRVVIDEGDELFTVPVPATLAGTQVGDEQIYRRTGVHLVGGLDSSGALLRSDSIPTGHTPHQLLLLGDRHAERIFRQTYLRRRR